MLIFVYFILNQLIKLMNIMISGYSSLHVSVGSQLTRNTRNFILSLRIHANIFIGNQSETDMSDRRPQHASSETDMPHRRRHAPSETDIPIIDRHACGVQSEF